MLKSFSNMNVRQTMNGYLFVGELDALRVILNELIVLI